MSLTHPSKDSGGKRVFGAAAERASNLTASPLFAALCLALGGAWAASHVLHWSEETQHILTGLMGFLSLILLALLKNSERRVELAVQQKLDALLAAAQEARGDQPNQDVGQLLEQRQGVEHQA